ncbi:MAG: hypothetical protein HWQ38_14600 [Nostoc sp. NMS7]|uniref:hypothetical protein n=1 Tax=Nostoc sp. NMS7 TaxID=2815391 RepID=UPI0025D75529|nr:hypothetical protein [Nostoc sp. NMS7]MBN3947613.1 hypothetical protein [Nostoc sp. NMS7]
MSSQAVTGFLDLALASGQSEDRKSANSLLCDRTFSNSGKELANSPHGQSSTSTNVNCIYKSEEMLF